MSADVWVVILRSGNRDDDTYVYGPLAGQEQAEQFAEFLTREVDPAKAYRVESPIGQVLSWYGNWAVETPKQSAAIVDANLRRMGFTLGGDP